MFCLPAFSFLLYLDAQFKDQGILGICIKLTPSFIRHCIQSEIMIVEITGHVHFISETQFNQGICLRNQNLCSFCFQFKILFIILQLGLTIIFFLQAENSLCLWFLCRYENQKYTNLIYVYITIYARKCFITKVV